MSPTKSDKIPDISWSTNDRALTWSLVAELEKVENYTVLFAQRGNRRQSQEAKVTVYKRIGQAILPDLFSLQPGAVADRVKSKIESLLKMYNKRARRLQPIEYESRDNNDGLLSATEISSKMQQQIEAEFPLFPPRLHRIFAAIAGPGLIAANNDSDHSLTKHFAAPSVPLHTCPPIQVSYSLDDGQSVWLCHVRLRGPSQGGV